MANAQPGRLCRGPNQEIDWFAFVPVLEQYVIDTQLAAGTLLFGRKTYEGMAAYWQYAEGQIAEFMNSVPKVVLAKPGDRGLAQHSRGPTEGRRGGVEAEEGTGGDIFVYGSADFVATLIANGLVDEYRLGISPVLLGAGTPLFKGRPDRLR